MILTKERPKTKPCRISEHKEMKNSILGKYELKESCVKINIRQIKFKAKIMYRNRDTIS